MADTPALGAGTRKGVEVRLLSSAKFKQYDTIEIQMKFSIPYLKFFQTIILLTILVLSLLILFKKIS